MTGAMPKRMFGKAGLLRQLTYSKPNTKLAAILATQVLVLFLMAAKSTSDRCVTDNDIAIAVRRQPLWAVSAQWSRSGHVNPTGRRTPEAAVVAFVLWQPHAHA